MGLTNVQGDIKLLSDLQTSEFLILNFYRGGWCPYCNMELREYDKLRESFNKLDVDVIGISAEITELANTTVKKNALSFPVFTDVNAELMKAVGLVFQLDEQSKKEFESLNESIFASKEENFLFKKKYTVLSEKKLGMEYSMENE